MTRALTTRERVMVAILAFMLVGLVYYLVVWKTYDNGMTEAQTRLEDAQFGIDEETPRVEEMHRMEAALNEIEKSGESAAPIAPFDNTKNIVAMLNTVLSGTETYSISFSDPADGDDGLVRRVVTMSISCKSYAEAKRIMTAIDECPYRNQITSTSMASRPGAGDSTNIRYAPVAMNMSVTFYEYR